MDKSLFFKHHRERPRKPKPCVFAEVGSSLFVFCGGLAGSELCGQWHHVTSAVAARIAPGSSDGFLNDQRADKH